MGGACFSKRAVQIHPGSTQVVPSEPTSPAPAALGASSPSTGAAGAAGAGAGARVTVEPPAGDPSPEPPEQGAAAATAAPQLQVTESPAQPSNPRPKKTLIKAVKDGNLALVDELLSGGCSLEEVGMWENTPLLAACAYGHCEISLRLISQRANIFARNEHGATPLHYAAVEGRIEVVQALLAAASSWGGAGDAEALVNCAPARVYNRHLDAYAPRAPLGAAAESGFRELAALLLAARACVDAANLEDGRSPLWLACRRGQAGAAGLLLEHKANASAKDAQGVSVLEAAATGGSEELIVALLAHGVRDVNDTAGSPLREAVRAGRRAAAEALLAHGASVAAPAEGQASPLHTACERGDEHLVALLIRARADPTAQDAAGLTAFDLLKRRGLTERQAGALLRPPSPSGAEAVATAGGGEGGSEPATPSSGGAAREAASPGVRQVLGTTSKAAQRQGEAAPAVLGDPKEAAVGHGIAKAAPAEQEATGCAEAAPAELDTAEAEAALPATSSGEEAAPPAAAAEKELVRGEEETGKQAQAAEQGNAEAQATGKPDAEAAAGSPEA